MRYQILVTDFDGTLARDGVVGEATIAALKRLLASGRRLVMITGRELPELMQVFSHLELFEWIVAENGGVLYQPSTKAQRCLAGPPDQRFVQALQEQEIGFLSVGQVIVATCEPHQAVVLDIIHSLGLELQVVFNKGAVMVLPAGVNKASGLKSALNEMEGSPHNTVGVGDAENDHAFLRLCEVSVAVGNAIDAIKQTADIITTGNDGDGVVELIDQIIREDLSSLNQHLKRYFLGLGTHDGEQISISPYGRSLLICGPSASGKSTVATQIVESLHDQHYQFCLIDPEGDYQELEGAVTFGSPHSAPATDEVIRLLANPKMNAVVCMTGMPISDRPELFLTMFSGLLHMRSQTGRPHWIILDEAHHLMPAEWQPANMTLPAEILNLLLVTVHPELLAPAMLKRIETVMVLGANARETLDSFGEAVGQPVPHFDGPELEPGEMLLWRRDTVDVPLIVRVHPCRMERRRHSRKYAAGELPPDRSFYFRGKDGSMKLRAQNLMVFLQLADGVDDSTWEFHLRQGDYSRWFSEAIKDDHLSAVAHRIEMLRVTPQESRSLIRAAVERDYTLPASVPMPVAGAS